VRDAARNTNDPPRPPLALDAPAAKVVILSTSDTDVLRISASEHPQNSNRANPFNSAVTRLDISQYQQKKTGELSGLFRL
jgi:hypothetical protein